MTPEERADRRRKAHADATRCVTGGILGGLAFAGLLALAAFVGRFIAS